MIPCRLSYSVQYLQIQQQNMTYQTKHKQQNMITKTQLNLSYKFNKYNKTTWHTKTQINITTVIIQI